MKNLVSILFLICAISVANAQNTTYRSCATDQMWEELIKKDPQAAVRRAQIKNGKAVLPAPAKRISSRGSSVQYRIPLVFHIMHTYGPENITKEQVEDAVRILNLTFQKLNPDTGDVIPLFQGIFANPEIEFELAKLDPNGNCTDGITRNFTPFTAFADDNVKTVVGWPNTMYLNIWVVKNIASGAAGYAYYPGASPNIDGIVMRNDYVGTFGTANSSNYTERSLAHEVGHYLNLPHTWGSSNTPGLASNCGIDDGIFDTPNTKGTANFSCNTAQNTCGVIDNVQNYMDYASCHKMFTEGQKAEMHSALQNDFARISLVDAANLVSTGTNIGAVAGNCAPIADFSNADVTICAGTTVTFKDVSWNGTVNSRSWTFAGGSPAIDTAANPSVTYNIPGVYDVTLSVSSAGGSDVITRPGIVNVLPSPGTNVIPYAEGFETLTLPAAEWAIKNPDGNNAWTISTVAAATGSKSMRLVNHSGNFSGSVDAIETPTFDLSNVSGTTFSFKVAYASKTNSDSSFLKVLFTNNCGTVWSQRYLKEGTTLATAPNTSSSFLPTTAQWRTEVVSLISNTFSGRPSVRARFEFTNYQGNNIYIDDIQISGTVGINEVLAEKFNFNAWPNPSKGDINIKFETVSQENISFELYDVTGRLVDANKPSQIGAGVQQMIIPAAGKSGVYILKMNIGNESFQQKITFIN